MIITFINAKNEKVKNNHPEIKKRMAPRLYIFSGSLPTLNPRDCTVNNSLIASLHKAGGIAKQKATLNSTEK